MSQDQERLFDPDARGADERRCRRVFPDHWACMAGERCPNDHIPNQDYCETCHPTMLAMFAWLSGGPMPRGHRDRHPDWRDRPSPRPSQFDVDRAVLAAPAD
ncbi:MAG: hypothetical protein ACRDM7_10065 [Thermoleophilaceae bacterium]